MITVTLVCERRYYSDAFLCCLRQTNISEEVKEQLLAVQQEHLKQSKEARLYLSECTAAAKDAVGDWKLGPHTPLTGPVLAHYSFDYAQQVRAFGR